MPRIVYYKGYLTVKVLLLVDLNKQKAQFGAFSGLCEISRSSVDRSGVGIGVSLHPAPPYTAATAPSHHYH